MATVPSLDHNFAMLQSGSSNTSMPERASATEAGDISPFGQMLQQKSEMNQLDAVYHRPAEQLPQNNAEQQDEVADKPQRFKLFADKTPDSVEHAATKDGSKHTEKPTNGLFKSKQTSKGDGADARIDARTAASKANGKTEVAQAIRVDTKANQVTDKLSKHANATTQQVETPVAKSQHGRQTGKGVAHQPGIEAAAQSKAVKARGTVSSEISVLKQNASAKTKGTIASQQQASQQSAAFKTPANNALEQLKTNVKAIFNSLPSNKSSATFAAATRSGAHNVSLAPPVVVDKVKPIRLGMQAAKQAPKAAESKTTVQYLKARKATNLADSSQLKAKVKATDRAAAHRVELTETAAQREVITAKENKPSVAVNDQSDAKKISKPVEKSNIELIRDASRKSSRKQRLLSKARSIIAGRFNRNASAQQGAQQAGDFSQSVRDVDGAKDNFQLHAISNQAAQTEFAGLETSSGDANSQNLLGKSETTAQASAAKKSSKASRAYAARSLSWVRSISEQTAALNRRDPNWKVLEMRLDKGDGHMTIKVMREDEHVSVSVQFTDDTMRAQAESQASQILETLKEEYGQDVKFSFADKKESAFDSELRDQHTRRRRLQREAQPVDKPVISTTYNPLGSDQHQWIG